MTLDRRQFLQLASGSLVYGFALSCTGDSKKEDAVPRKKLVDHAEIYFVDYTEWIGRLFLALIKMVVVPLVFFSLIVGMASLGDFRKLGRMGGVTLGFFTATMLKKVSIAGGAPLTLPDLEALLQHAATLIERHASAEGDRAEALRARPGTWTLRRVSAPVQR